MSPANFCDWLSKTPFSIWLREAPYPFPVLLIIHLLTIAFFGGMVLLGDLRLLGRAMQDIPVSQVLGQFRPWKWTAFGILVVTGVLLSISDPVEYCGNIMFWISLLLLLAVGVNALIFRLGVYRTIAEWDEAEVTPPEARWVGKMSLVLWILLVLAGRAIAFF